MTETTVGSEPNDIVSVLARYGAESDFPQLFFGQSKGDRNRQHFSHEPDDGEVMSLVLMAMEKLST